MQQHSTQGGAKRRQTLTAVILAAAVCALYLVLLGFGEPANVGGGSLAGGINVDAPVNSVSTQCGRQAGPIA